jgi:hypothetical protein
VLVHGPWIIAVGVAPDLFCVLGTCSERQVPPAIKEQLTGYLFACGIHVVRLSIRFPLRWHASARLDGTLAFWIGRWVDTLSISMGGQVGVKRTRLALPIGELAFQAWREWALVLEIWSAVEAEHASALPLLTRLLWEVSRRWEIRWALALSDAARYDYVTPQERAQVGQCDSTWMILVRRYLHPRGYMLLSDTIARLL